MIDLVTASITASARAIESARPHALFRDPHARRFADATGRVLLQETGGERSLATMAVRTRWFDERIARAALLGKRAIAIVGAGFDARAFRLDLPPGTAIVEIDRAEILERKARALVGDRPLAARATLALDLASDELEPRLRDAFRALEVSDDVPRVFVLEGVVGYLPEALVANLLATFAKCAVPETELLFDVPNASGVAPDGPNAVGLRALALHGAPMRFGTDDPSALLARLGLAGETLRVGHPRAHYGRLPAPPREQLAVEEPGLFLVRARIAGAADEPDAWSEVRADPLAWFYDADLERESDAAAPLVAPALPVLGALAGRRIADVGCGTGRAAIELARAGAFITAIDPERRMIARARAKLAREAPDVRARVRLVEAGEHEANVDAGAYDVVLMLFHVLQYIGDAEAQREAIARASRALAPGGELRLDLVDPAFPGVGERATAETATRWDARSGTTYRRITRSEPIGDDGAQRLDGRYEVETLEGRVSLPFELDMWLVSPSEVMRMIEAAGLVAKVDAAAIVPAGSVAIAATKPR